MADQTVPLRPQFTEDLLTASDDDGLLRDTDDARWQRAVVGDDGSVCAAQDAEGRIWVWDEDVLFRAVFQAAGETDG